MADEQDTVGHVEIAVGPRLPIRAEGLPQRGRGRRGAEPRVAVHIVAAEAGFAQHGESIVLLEEKLSRAIDPDRVAGVFRDELPGSIDEETHRVVPARGLELAVLATDEWRGQPIGALV